MLNESAHVVNFTGIVHASLRTMHDVEQGTRLQVGQTFGKNGQKKASGVKRARRYCQCCGGHSHVTNDCWKLPSNAHKRPAQFAVLDVEQSEEQSKGEESEKKLVQTGTAD
jgi:hypothetical protein